MTLNRPDAYSLHETVGICSIIIMLLNAHSFVYMKIN